MMVQRYGRFGLLLIVLICFPWIFGCYDSRVIVGEPPIYSQGPPPGPPHKEPGPPPWAPAHGHRAKYQYRYYPASAVYFDTGRKLYFYWGAGYWQASISLPTGLHIDGNNYVSLEMDTKEPYEYHSEVVKKYPPGQMKKKFKAKGNGKWS
jgi:hypothetical protein